MNERIDRAVRASDTERERIAKMVSEAAGEGRLSLAEADERLDAIYATKFRHELAEFVSDLPREEPARAVRPGATGLDRFPIRLRVHAAIAVVLSVFLILRWVAMDVPYFWPAGPMFFLWGSLLLHARFVGAIGRGRPRWARQGSSPPWWVERQSRGSG